MATNMIATSHDHSRGYSMRAFPGLSGVFVRRYGGWVRPLHVSAYRGTWRVVCHPCLASVPSDNGLYDWGWPTQEAAFTAAYEHCRACPVGRVTE